MRPKDRETKRGIEAQKDEGMKSKHKQVRHIVGQEDRQEGGSVMPVVGTKKVLED